MICTAAIAPHRRRGAYVAGRTVKCPCGVTFRTERTAQRFCSIQCAGIYRRQPESRNQHLRRRVTLSCPCGASFEVQEYRAESALYCSRACKGVYEEVRPNDGQFKPGDRRSPETEFKKGQEPHNRLADPAMDYEVLHDWVRRTLGLPERCTHCDTTDPAHRLQWANVSYEYRADPADWMALCYRCHRAYDRNFGWGRGAAVFERSAGHYGRRR